MHPRLPVRLRRLHRLAAASCATALLTLAGCGGGSDDVAAAGSPATGSGTTSSALAGTVAVGAPITNGKLRILDADGAVVAADVPIDADGHYTGVALSGPAPYRLEACGYAGGNYVCLYGVATASGTANVTPLTTATILLATGQAPDTMMKGSAPALSASGVAAAQDQLRSGLAGVLAGAGVSGTLDFVSGTLAAGSRSGYDGVLDAIGITVGQDAKPFVQITPRLGTGNLYLEQGTTSGAVTAADTSTLKLNELETLFKRMSAALASPAACASPSNGIRLALADDARMSLGDGAPAQGGDAVAAGLCGFFAGGEDGNTPMWGSTLLSPKLGKCNLSGPSAVCNVTFVLKSAEGDVVPVGNGMGVKQVGGAWKFLGDLLPVNIYASAKAQRTKRIDGANPVHDYSRALAFEVAVVPGLACARVAQRNADGAVVPIGYYKRHPGANDQRNLALWTDGFGDRANLDLTTGGTRSGDDTWIGLPQGAEGDAVIRNFYRGGRTVTVSLYGNDACTTPFVVEGASEFEVDVEGVPPVWAAMESLPWPELDATSQAAVRSLAIGAGMTGSVHASWTFARGPLGLNGATVCASRADCGRGGNGRLGEAQLRPGALETTVALDNRGGAVAADTGKTLALYGRNGEGIDLQSNYSSCPMVTAGEACH